MTTNAIDWIARQVTSDTRWSVKMDGSQMLFVDDTDFDKLALRKDTCLVLAGDAPLIEMWKHWLHDSDEVDVENLPPTELKYGDRLLTISICMVTLPEGKLEFDAGEAIRFQSLARFAGSGQMFAFISWLASKCTLTAIGIAAIADPCSGGTPKYLALGSRSNNLSPQTRESLSFEKTAVHDLLTRGNHMDLATKKVTPIAEHKGAQEWLTKVPAGSLSYVASAPIGCEIKWTDEKRAELQAALRRAKAAGKL